jgi:hypothetical protein
LNLRDAAFAKTTVNAPLTLNATTMIAVFQSNSQDLVALRQNPLSIRFDVGHQCGFRPVGLHAPTIIGAACILSQMASTVNGIATCHSKHRVQRCQEAVIFTVLKTSRLPRWKALMLCSGSFSRPHGKSKKGLLPGIRPNKECPALCPRLNDGVSRARHLGGERRQRLAATIGIVRVPDEYCPSLSRRLLLRVRAAT